MEPDWLKDWMLEDWSLYLLWLMRSSWVGGWQGQILSGARSGNGNATFQNMLWEGEVKREELEGWGLQSRQIWAARGTTSRGRVLADLALSSFLIGPTQVQDAWKEPGRGWHRQPSRMPGFRTMHEPQELLMQQVLSRLTELLLSRASWVTWEVTTDG